MQKQKSVAFSFLEKFFAAGSILGFSKILCFHSEFLQCKPGKRIAHNSNILFFEPFTKSTAVIREKHQQKNA